MSFYRLPHPWDPNYAIPKYVMAEPPERGVFVTNWLPRGTIPTLIPDYLAAPGPSGSPKSDLGSLGVDTLDAAGAAAKAAAAAAAASIAAQLNPPKPVDNTMRNVAIVAGLGLGAYLLLRKKR